MHVRHGRHVVKAPGQRGDVLELIEGGGLDFIGLRQSLMGTPSDLICAIDMSLLCVERSAQGAKELLQIGDLGIEVRDVDPTSVPSSSCCSPLVSMPSVRW